MNDYDQFKHWTQTQIQEYNKQIREIWPCNRLHYNKDPKACVYCERLKGTVK